MLFEKTLINLTTVIPRFWQLVGAAKMCGQNRVVPKSENQTKIP